MISGKTSGASVLCEEYLATSVYMSAESLDMITSLSYVRSILLIAPWCRGTGMAHGFQMLPEDVTLRPQAQHQGSSEPE
jgi:hypothetical protein